MNVHKRTEEAKEKLWEYICARKNITSPQVCKDLGLTKNQAIHYLKFLTERGYITKLVQRHTNKRFAIYNAGQKPFKKKAKPIIEDTVDRTVYVPHARIVKLTDRPYFSDSIPKKHKTTVSIGSGMNLFSNWG
jgi:predicted ArsR family transcriptional regulator